MEGASTNICYNVLDRNVHERKLGDKVAFYWLVCVCVCDSCGRMLTWSLCSGFKVSVCSCVFTVSFGLRVSASTRTSPADLTGWWSFKFPLCCTRSTRFRFSEGLFFFFSSSIQPDETNSEINSLRRDETKKAEQKLSCDDKHRHTLKSLKRLLRQLSVYFLTKRLKTSWICFLCWHIAGFIVAVSRSGVSHHPSPQTSKAGTEPENQITS